MDEVKEVEVKEFYKIKYREPIRQKGQLIIQNARLGIDGAVYEVGDVAELTPERMRSVGEQYFEKLTETEYKEWISSKKTKRFLPENTSRVISTREALRNSSEMNDDPNAFGYIEQW